MPKRRARIGRAGRVEQGILPRGSNRLPAGGQHLLDERATTKVLGSRPEEAATASGIATEWQSAESAHNLPGSAVLGPGAPGQPLAHSRTFFPITARSPAQVPQSRGWSVAYTDLDQLIAASRLGAADRYGLRPSSYIKSSPAAPARAASPVGVPNA